ncbi:hypothetical protein EC957_000883 [Mortierella hygrophila]|uniref:Uncharacterized protein n=1 Tax=Mortierella hygrophila TaxID=979708 RepID=A0A9P6F5I5_9FUNG|nr:hypothetical protein EC957_000883 [Mortierella hygrophila]
MTLTFRSSTPQKKPSFMSRIFSTSPTSHSKPKRSFLSGSSSSSSSSSSSNSPQKNKKTPFMSRFSRTPEPTTMDKVQAKLSPSSDATPVAIAAKKKKAKAIKAKKEAKAEAERNRKRQKKAGSGSFFSRP